MRDTSKLLLIVLSGVAVRMATLWIGRAEFVGWLNHSYYYFVQTRELLGSGALPYADMPLLFWVYALIARVFITLGLVPGEAIVAATRLVMSIVPSLMPLATYRIVCGMNGREPVSRNQWALIFVSGFLPLSLSHLPEFSQKNTLGLLLLAVLMVYSQRLLLQVRGRDLAVVTLLGLAIVLTHFGTFAAAALFGLAMLLAYVVVERSLGRAIAPALLLAVGTGLAAGLVYVFDPQRFDRILVYVASSFENSLIGGLLSTGGGRSGLLASLAAVAAVYALLAGMYVAYSRSRSALPAHGQIFWLANILFCGLLMLPVLDEALMGRLAVFASLPLLVLVLHLEKYSVDRPWLRTTTVVAIAAVVALLSVGELVSSRIHNRNHQAVLADIRQLQEAGVFQSNDLVLTRSGAEHVCNWFFDVRAGMITSLTLDDFARYGSVYVLNPLDGGQSVDDMVGRRADDERTRYRFMRANIPRPASVEPLFRSDAIEVFELEVPPADWSFDEGGRWVGYSGASDPW